MRPLQVSSPTGTPLGTFALVCVALSLSAGMLLGQFWRKGKAWEEGKKGKIWQPFKLDIVTAGP